MLIPVYMPLWYKTQVFSCSKEYSCIMSYLWHFKLCYLPISVKRKELSGTMQCKRWFYHFIFALMAFDIHADSSVLHKDVIQTCAPLIVVNTKITIFWDVTPCSLVVEYSLFQETYHLLFLPRRWRRQFSTKHWYLPSKLHSVIPQKTILGCHTDV
jgi:hypothetical protein